MNKLIIALLLLTTGCAHNYRAGLNYGKFLNKHYPIKSCLPQARAYQAHIGGEIMINKTHAWVVKNGRVYDSSKLIFDGLRIDDHRVVKEYGHKSTWMFRN